MESPSEFEPNPALGSTPRVGMEFDSPEDAWKFWLEYGGKVGFHVRKHFKNEKVKGEITSRGFVCGNEGHRKIDKRNREIQKHRVETRTGCPVHFFVKLIRETKRYQVYEFFGDHNHPLQRPEAVGLMRSQRSIPESYGVSIDLADDAGLRPKDGYELMAQEAGGTQNFPFRKSDYANHVRNKRRRSLACGEGSSMLRYFSNKSLENDSFQHAEERDEDGQITNVFWADAKMLIDYGQFGDVITFDTTYGTNKQFRPLGVFVGFNHFREIVVFGATLLYNESIDSFKWLFEKFLAAHNNKHPKTIFTDQDQAMAVALEEVMPNTYHGLCTWHIGKNAIKNLTGKKKNEPGTTLDVESQNLPENSAQNAIILKKKTDNKRKSSKRLSSWVDSGRTKKSVSMKKNQTRRKASSSVPNLISKDLEMDKSSMSSLPAEYQEYEHINSYMNLLMGYPSAHSTSFSDFVRNASLIKEKNIVANQEGEAGAVPAASTSH